MNEETVFHLARDKPPHERAAFLEAACAGDADMRQRVEVLLEADDGAGSFLQTPVNEQLATSAFRPEGGHAPSSTHCLDGATPEVKSEPTVAETAPSKPEGLGFLAPGSRLGSIGRLGHYEILEVIGKGGFGTVLKAFDDKLHRVVAIKVLSLAYADNGAARKRFIREAHTAAAVKNEHVVAIYDVEKDSQPPYLAMEMIEGVSLQDTIDKQGPLDIREILRIGMQMAEGLAAAHKQGLVHRDIKPANILLENGVERVKITDFGLARAVDDASVTQSGTVAGTPMFMSPEQAEGLQVDHRSDLFSLGTVLYAMCTGHPPFRASGTHAVLKRVIDASPRPIREINNEIPDWLCAIIAKLHAKKPEDRFQTAKEVAELLGQALAHVQQPAHAAAPAVPLGVRVAGATPPPAAVPPDRAAGPPTPHPWTIPAFARRWILPIAAGMLVVATVYRVTGVRVLEKANITISADDPELKVTPFGLEPGTTKIEGSSDKLSLSPGKYNVCIKCGAGRRLKSVSIADPALRGAGTPPRTFAGGEDEVQFELKLHRRQQLTLVIKTAPIAPFDAATAKERDTLKGSWVAISGEANGEALPNEFLKTLNITFDDEFHLKITDFLESRNTFAVDANAAPRTITTSLIKSKATWNGDGKVQQTAAELMRRYTLDTGFKGTYQLEGNRLKLGIAQNTHADGTAKVGPLNLILVREEPGWVQLFNGKDHSGWVVQAEANAVRPERAWEILDNILIARGSPEGYLRTEKAYHRYILEMECQASQPDPGWAGALLFHIPVPDPGFPRTDGMRLRIEPGRHGFFAPLGGVAPFALRPVDWRTFKPDWNHLRFESTAGRFEILLNGKSVLKFTEFAGGFPPGYFGIMSAGNGMRYRNIRIKELPPEEPGWVQLFNRKDLTGWTSKNSPFGIWKMEQGQLIGQGNQARLRTERDNFTDFHLRVEAKYTGHAHLVIREQADTVGKGYTIFMGSEPPGFKTGALTTYFGKKAGPMNPQDKELTKTDEWFTLEIIAKGNRLQVFVNGLRTADAEDANKNFMEGFISFRMTSPEGELHVRKLEIKELR